MNPTVSYSSRPFTTCLAQVNHISSLTDQSPRLICSLQKSWNHQSQSSLHTLNRAKVSDTPSIRTRCNGNRLLRLASNSSPMQPPSLCTKRVQYVTPFRILKTPFRTYHSDLHAPPLPTHEYTNSQTAILTAALEHVPTHGFTKEALTLGARDSGFLDVSVQLLTRQEMDLILFWLASRRGLIRAQVESGLFSEEQQQANLANTVRNKELVVEDKVRTLVLERLRMNKSIIHKWQDVSCFFFLSLPFSSFLSPLFSFPIFFFFFFFGKRRGISIFVFAFTPSNFSVHILSSSF